MGLKMPVGHGVGLVPELCSANQAVNINGCLAIDQLAEEWEQGG